MDVDFSSAPAFSPPASNGVQPLCGLFVPGGMVRSDFVYADATGMKRTIQMSSPGDLPSPLASVTELACFLWPQNCPLPQDHGVMIYWQITGADPNVQQQPSTGFELLGTLTPDKPSQIFRTGWSEHEQLLDIMSSNIPVMVTFGLSIEPLASIVNVQGVDRIENRMFVAHKIASDLFKYMQSFDTGGSAGQMIVPTNVFDRWMKRFEVRFRRDPNFFLKTEDGS